MLRASAACEAAGFPSSSMVGDGFLKLAESASIGQGMPNLPVARFPGHPGVQSKEQLRDSVFGVTMGEVINNLLEAPAQAIVVDEPEERDIVVSGSFEEVNEYFLAHGLSDGLPIVPPTPAKVAEFLRYTDSPPERVIGILPPDKRAATVHSIAVNGVMAGCRPEYMPILVALIEAMADPYYGVEHSGNTPGAETLIILNGPIIKELKFNYTQGVMRDGIQANTSIGRFWRLYLRNVAGFLHHGNDKATYGNTWRVVVAENEDVVKKIGWEPNSVEMGFEAGDNVVTVARYTGGHHIGSVSGSKPEQMMPYLADAMLRQISWHLCFTIGKTRGTLRPLLMLSPILAETMAAGGWSKADLKRALFEQARMPAWQVERMLHQWNLKYPWNIKLEVNLGRAPRAFLESDDPQRMVPLVWEAEDYMVMVTGDLSRNSAYIFASNGGLGYPTARKIRLPRNWNDLRSEAART